MAAYSTGANWAFPEDLPGGWVKVEEQDAIHTPPETADEGIRVKPEPADPAASSTAPPWADGVEQPQEFQSAQSDEPTPQQQQRRRHWPPRQCRICLEVVQPTFLPPDDFTASLPQSFQAEPRVVYETPGDGGRLLRPCKCKGSQKYVHEQCLAAWRLQDPLQRRNYWQCPTCSYKYHLQRLTWGSWISSTAAQIGLTFFIFFLAMFILGFVADPIINLYLDPVTTIATAGGPTGSLVYDGEATSWGEHFIKGLASLGLLGFAKFLLTLSPWHWFNMRGTGVYVGGSGGRGGAATGRDRLTQLSWITIIVGIATFLYAVWKGVRAWSRRTLEKAGEQVMDVPCTADGDDEDD